MGQAVAEPNPLDAPPPASLSGTDDLLAQLAGDEIDRLLAEADVERTPSAPVAAAPTPAPPQAIPASTAAPPSTQSTAQPLPLAPVATGDELDQLLSTLNPESASGPARTKTLTEQVPDVLAELAVTSPVSLGQGAAAPQTPAPNVAPAAATAPGEPLDAVMSPAEREALSLSNLEAATAAAEQQDASAAAAAAAAAAAEKSAVQAAGSAPARVNPVIRLLEMLNAPLSFIPDAARDPIGKAAIVTIVNSLAVLIYVLFVRH
jgi:hypothetical protein